MDPSGRVLSLDAQGNMVFTVVKPVMGIFQVSSEQTGSTATQGLSENTLILPPTQGQAQLEQNQVEMHTIQPHMQPQMQLSSPVQTDDVSQNQDLLPNSQPATQMPFAEVSSLLDPNMKGSKARKLPLFTFSLTANV